MSKDYKQTLQTNSGMWAIWDYDNFKNITDYDSWENNLNSDDFINEHIKNNIFIPININSDGNFEFKVKIVDSDTNKLLSEKELKYKFKHSIPYYLKTNGIICLSGIEFISNDINENILKITVLPGFYECNIFMIDWTKDPNSLDLNGNPTSNALSDFIITIKSVSKDNKMENQIDFKTKWI